MPCTDPMENLKSVVLTAHPATPADAVRALGVQVKVRDAHTLYLRYTLGGKLEHVVVPPAAPSERADGLWRHTCFEAFVAFDGDAGYYEVNLSPSGQWALYRFDGYRTGMAAVPVSPPPRIRVQRQEAQLELEVDLVLPLAARQQPRAGRLGLSAVIEEDNGRLSYWALRHPPGKPDFHHPDSRGLEFAP